MISKLNVSWKSSNDFTHVFFTVYFNFSLQLSTLEMNVWWMKNEMNYINVFTSGTSAKNWMKTNEWLVETRENRVTSTSRRRISVSKMFHAIHQHEHQAPIIKRARNMRKLNGFIDRLLCNSDTFLIAELTLKHSTLSGSR